MTSTMAVKGKDNSGKLFDHIRRLKKLESDAELARFLEVSAPAISNVRHGRLVVGPTLILTVLEKTDMTIPAVRALIAG